MAKLPKFLAEDKLLSWLLLGVFGPLALLALMWLFASLGLRGFFPYGDKVFEYGLFVFGISIFILPIYISFFKKTQNPKTTETKALISIWLLISFFVFIIGMTRMTPGDELSYSVGDYENLALLLFVLGVVLTIIGIPFLFLNFIMSKATSQKRQITIFSLGSFVTATIITAVLMYVFQTNNEKIEIYTLDLEGRTEFVCSSKMEVTLFPRQNFKDSKLETIDGTLARTPVEGNEMAIEIEDGVVKMLTAASVELGITEPAEFTIVKDDEDELIAIFVDSEESLSPSVDTFILHKKKGAAVWTKTQSSFFTIDLPNAQAYYMECY